jgi:hypothetical protein
MRLGMGFGAPESSLAVNCSQAALCAFDLLGEFTPAEPSPGIVFAQACKLGCEGIVSKRLGPAYRSGRSKQRLKVKNPAAPAVRREAQEDWR